MVESYTVLHYRGVVVHGAMASADTKVRMSSMSREEAVLPAGETNKSDQRVDNLTY